ncbi:hypothetical protein [Rhodopirellula bahusiensis]|uniref:Uncharacterized protein n=1 Tax=Rhodopirellula bahusiensis TaxID=2014065 RepID=A0A2G1WA15_9BACT|nr:hypothetical protein [Rhodopirellula bahusiensis]PHQ35874.1 hypothetical protein CEE69_06565 [Rhodopirellula bahusiensis]
MSVSQIDTDAKKDTRRLGIYELMLITAGIAVAFAINRGLSVMRHVPDWAWRGAESAARINGMDVLVACVYGMSLSVYLLAIRSKPFWNSPGKTLALLFATMCLLDWTLDFFASSTVALRFLVDPQAGNSNTAGYVLGIWYEQFSARLGYLFGLPVLILAIIQSRQQHLTWRLAWVGFLVFDLAIVAVLNVDSIASFPRTVLNWYFEIALGIPVVLLAIAFFRGMVKRDLDWWTVLTCVPVFVAWMVAVVMRSLGP